MHEDGHAPELAERIKELKCLQGASRLIASSGLDPDDVLQGIADLIPSGWQYPDDAMARILLKGRAYRSAGFAESPWHLRAGILRDGTEIGSVEVCYRSLHPPAVEGPFLREERDLLDTLAQQIGDYVTRLEAEERLRQEQAQLRALFEGTDDIIYVADPKTYELLYVNPSFRRQWGEGAIGQPCFRVLQDRDTPCPFCSNPIIFGEKLGRSHVWEFQNEITNRWYRCTDKAIKWSDGRMVRLEIAADITSEKRMLVERHQLDKLSALGRLTAGVAHELNNPLMGIINYAQYCLSETPEDDPRREPLTDIERETRRCIDIVQDLLTYSRTGSLDHDPSGFVDTNLWEIVERSIRLLDYRLRAERVQLELDGMTALPLVPLKPNLIQQVIVNLMTNALDAMKGREPATLSMSCRLADDSVILSIKDTGPGIPIEVRDQIFDPFFTTKETGEGTGLGLSTSLAIAREHGGDLACTSREGLGTTMIVQVPIVRPSGEQPS